MLISTKYLQKNLSCAGWQKLHGSTVAYFTELILQICDYAQKRRIWRENCKYALDEDFHFRFCSRWKAAKFCHPAPVPRVLVNQFNVFSIFLIVYSSLCSKVTYRTRKTLQWSEDSNKQFCSRPIPSTNSDWERGKGEQERVIKGSGSGIWDRERAIRVIGRGNIPLFNLPLSLLSSRPPNFLSFLFCLSISSEPMFHQYAMHVCYPVNK